MSIAIEEVITKLTNFVYCFQIKLASGEELNLTNSDHAIKSEERVFLPNSGLDLKEAEFNDSAQNHIIIEGIFEENGITTAMDLNNAIVKIIIYTDKLFEHFVTYYCTLYTKYDLNFKIHLKPETVKYNQTVINRYSKTCRAVFGDSKCKIDKALYSGIYKVKEMLKENLRILNLDKENGYYNGGQIIFGENRFNSKVLSNFGDLIILEDIIPDAAKDAEEVKITAGCDKNFISCCNKFNNAINFRGEPLIQKKDFINLV
ncbi:DUF2163 domain-containing protein [Rickettsia asembonensis]|uniref:Bacteriophage phiJL001 Gp84 C-terminal domain-containing protein n=1 Tax=Rickettsia asembonensis TaxID=1068590 RepID=A0A0C2M0C2_9RICK|nr:phage BR0599 family protein [Rickettsia asembonensis]KIJ89122.1 hypothetical protein SB78_01430 [Rickettsia asembonensis]